MATKSTAPSAKPETHEFRNEPFTDFSKPENRTAMQAAIDKVRSQLGREYDILIGGEKIRTVEKLKFCVWPSVAMPAA